MWPFTTVPTIPNHPPAPRAWAEGDFDIEHVSVIAVERAPSNCSTAIGYLTPKGRVKEWWLPVSPTKHDDLVRRFRAKIGQPPITSSNP